MNDIITITTLVDNEPGASGLPGEHGFSVHIETPHTRILFDTGASGLFAKNAQTLGIDISRVDHLILSHGHCDHTGGISRFLELNSRADIMVKPGIFRPKYKGQKSIGMPLDEASVRDRLRAVTELTEVSRGIYIVTNIPIAPGTLTHFGGFRHGPLPFSRRDGFEDELFLCLEDSDRISIVTGCSHRGVENIAAAAREHFPSRKPGTIFGGFHLLHDAPDRIEKLATALSAHRPERIALAHCSGHAHLAAFQAHCPCPVSYRKTGSTLILGDSSI